MYIHIIYIHTDLYFLMYKLNLVPHTKNYILKLFSYFNLRLSVPIIETYEIYYYRIANEFNLLLHIILDAYFIYYILEKYNIMLC